MITWRHYSCSPIRAPADNDRDVPQAVVGDGDECAIRPQLRRIRICNDSSITLPQPFVRPFGPTRIGRSQLVNLAMLSGSVRRQWVPFQPMADQRDMA